jgi:predicted O-methyltransferase YrrM
MILAYASLLLLLANLAGALLIYRKIKRVDLETWDLKSFIRNQINIAEGRLYRQLESLQALDTLLKLPAPLPPLREWAGSPDFLLELGRETISRQPMTIVECSSGASTVVAARCCQLNGKGHVFSLENATEFADKTRRLLHDAGLDDWATVIHAPLEPISISGDTYPWYSLAGLPKLPIDILIVDGPPGFLRNQARYPAGALLIPRLSEGGIVMLDDANRDDERRIIARWKSEFPELDVETRSAEKGLALLIKTKSNP